MNDNSTYIEHNVELFYINFHRKLHEWLDARYKIQISLCHRNPHQIYAFLKEPSKSVDAKIFLKNIQLSWNIPRSCSFYVPVTVGWNPDPNTRIYMGHQKTRLIISSDLIHSTCHRANVPGSKVNVANMGHTWVLLAVGGPHVGRVNLAIRGNFFKWYAHWPIYGTKPLYMVLKGFS